MAVYERTYTGYHGALTPAWSRFLVLPRFAFQQVFASRLFLTFFVGCLTPWLVAMIIIYLKHNLKVLQLLEIQAQDIVRVDATFFLTLLSIQGLFLGFSLVVVAGPDLISRDLANNGLPLYLSRPFSRSEYILGKMSVLVILLSALTWIPNLLVFFLQSYLAGDGWMGEHVRIAAGVFAGSWVWILTLSLLALAVSASVKRKRTARLGLIGAVLILSVFGELITDLQGLWWGRNLNLFQMTEVVWYSLAGVESPYSTHPTSASAWVTLIAVGAVSALILARKVKAYEVVRR